MSQDAPEFEWDASTCSKLKICLIAASFNPELVDGMLATTRRSLADRGVRDDNIHIERVPGSAELPFAVQQNLQEHPYHVVVALGVLIAGETQHHDIVARTVALGLQRISLDHQKPVINGVISAETYSQAEDRA